MRMPSTGRPRARRAPCTARSRNRKLVCTISRRSALMCSASSFDVFAIESGSWSNPITRPPRRMISLVWPPPPNVQSTYTPSRSIARYSQHSCRSTGTWYASPASTVVDDDDDDDDDDAAPSLSPAPPYLLTAVEVGCGLNARHARTATSAGHAVRRKLRSSGAQLNKSKAMVVHAGWRISLVPKLFGGIKEKN